MDEQEPKYNTRFLFRDIALFGIFILIVSTCLYFSDQYADYLEAVGDERYINAEKGVSPRYVKK